MSFSCFTKIIILIIRAVLRHPELFPGSDGCFPPGTILQGLLDVAWEEILRQKRPLGNQVLRKEFFGQVETQIPQPTHFSLSTSCFSFSSP